MTSLYWLLVLGFQYIALALALRSIIPELTRLEFQWLIIFLLIALPMAPKYGPNAFMHENIALSLRDSPLSGTHCIHYKNSECLQASEPPWSHAYHIVLSQFASLGPSGAQIVNSLGLFIGLVFLALTFGSPRKALVAVIPTFLVMLSTPHLGTWSFGIGAAYFYFLLKHIDGEAGPFAATLVGAYFLHIRPENFIYVALSAAYLLSALKRRPLLASYFTVSWVVKVAEYVRGLGFTPEWGLQLATRANLFAGSFSKNLVFLINPFVFNVFLTALTALGVYKLFKEGEYSLAILVPVSFFIYSTKFQTGSFYPGSRFLLGFVTACIPALKSGLKRVKLPATLLLVVLVPFASIDFAQSNIYRVHEKSLEHRGALLNLSKSESLPILTYAPSAFQRSESVFYVDDFPYPSGEYVSLVPTTHHPACEFTRFWTFGDLETHKASCSSSID